MIVSIGLILLGLLLLVGGGEFLLRGAVGLATLARLTPAVIGLTVVAAGTSVPELAVSASAAIQGSTDIAVANVVGSNIFNIAFILGLCAVVCPMAVTGNTVRLEMPVLLAVTVLTLALLADGDVNRIDAVLFLGIYVGFTIYLIRLVRRQVTAEEAAEFRSEVDEIASPENPPRLWVSLGLVIAGIALLAGGAHATVTGAVQLARLLGMSERVIGLTIVSIGTSLPEIVASLISSIRGRSDVAIGNVIGSNLFNILVILGLSGAIAPLSVSAEIFHTDCWWMLGVTVLLVPILLTGRRVSRAEGGLLLTVYAVYLGLVLRSAV